MPQFFSGQSPIFSQQMNDPRAGLAQALIQGGTQATPVNSPLEGVGRLASALGGAWMAKQQRAEQEAKKAAAASTLSQAIAGYNAPEIVPGPPVLDLGSGDQGDTGVGFGAGEGTAEQPTFDQTERQLTPDEKASRLVQALASNPDLAPVAANIQLTQAMAQQDAQRKAEAAAAAREQELRDKKVRPATPEEYAARNIDPNQYMLEVDAFGNFTPTKISDVLSPKAEAQKARLAAAGRPETNINTGDKPTDKRLITLLDENDEIGRRIQRLSSMQELSANAPTGLGAEFKAWGTRLADTMGLDVNMDDVQTLEQFRVAQMDFVMDRISGTKGAVSEKEMRAFEEAGPNIANTPLGNVIISKVMRAQAEREYALNEVEAEALEQTGSVVEARKKRAQVREQLMREPILAEEELAVLQGGASPADNDPLGIR